MFLILIIGCGEENAVFPDDQIILPMDTLQIVWAIGEEISDSTYFFGSIIAAGIDEQGRVIVLDEIECCLKVYDMQGNYIQQISRRGSGPGESNYPKGMFIMPDGRIGINSSDKQGYIVFDDSFEYLEEISLWMGNSPYHLTPISNNRIAVCRYSENPPTDILRHTLAIYEWGESEWETLLWKDSMEVTDSEFMHNPSPAFIFGSFDLLSTCSDGNGNIYLAPVDPYEYRVIGWDSTGIEILNFTRDMTPVTKTSEEIADEIYYVNSNFQRISGGPLFFDFQPAPYKNMVTGVGIGPDSNLWVRSGTHNEPFFDIYNMDGNLLRHEIFPVDGWSWELTVTPNGILAWELDPLEGYQKLYLLE